MLTQLPESRVSPQATPRFPELPVRLEKDLVQVFKLLADETRLKILLYLLREGELNVTSLCERLGQSQPAVSHHLALLRVAGLIEPRRDGKHNFYSVQSTRFHGIVAELFASITAEGDQSEVRIDDLVIRQEQDDEPQS
ncbi:MAG: winged helix-turn-helix transcriptional regulator [Planctomycetaceae bacterium]|nr:winged helix-turn-helix transcriptional regulator [Planctomycetaceae bacterium]